VIAALISAFGDVLRANLGSAGQVVAQVVQIVVGLGITWLLFALMFKYMPDVKISWKDVRLGALVTAVLFTVGRFVIGLYLGHNTSTNAFGAAAALAVLLIWIYYAALILLIGAEFTQAWVQQHGRTIEPEEGAVKVEVREVRQKTA
jgi:membrane protein